MSRSRAWTTVAVIGFALAACVPHPVGPARTYSKFEGKASTTAESALSQIETVRLAAGAAEKGQVFGPYLSVLVSEAEDSITTTQSTFDSIQPPDDRADAVAEELDSLLTDAATVVRNVRLAARRGDLAQIAAEAAPLADTADKLNRFSDTHS